MAQIDVKTIEKLNKDRNTIHDKVYTTYSTFNCRGKHYVQIDTYGRSEGEIPGKISQSIQLDEESANRLLGFVMDNELMYPLLLTTLRYGLRRSEVLGLKWGR